MADTMQLNQIALPGLTAIFEEFPEPNMIDIERNRHLSLISLPEESLLHELTLQVYSGKLIIYIEKLDAFFSLDIANPPSRAPEEPTTESSIKGPQDGFTEELITNTGLLRKRLRTQSLCVEHYNAGKRGENKIGLFYISDIINEDILQEIRRNLNSIDTDAIMGTSFIENVVTNEKNAFFPLTDYTGRPDFAVDALLNGKFVVIVDGIPMAIVAPVTITTLFTSPEDENTSYYIVSMQKILRVFGLLISMLLPGFYVALTSYNLEQVPLPLLATISNSRHGLPFPIQLEAFIMLFLFEIFNEAGRRLPKAVGQTVTVVGGLIIGDAAIRAGITSPTIIVTVAIATVATYTLVNQSLTGAVSQFRLYILFVSSILGMFGFLISVIGLVFYLAYLESYGVPYLSPISPFHKKDFIQAVIKKPSGSSNQRSGIFHPKDNTSKGE
ncbi:Spore germination protein XA [compost metagenome]